jgi:tetratricopeptide (TPR) repeat protein
MLKQINGKEYQVLSNEFEMVTHERFNCLKIIPELGEMERIVSLLKEVSRHLSLTSFVHSYPTHGGFIPIQLSTTIENIFISALDSCHIETTLHNIQSYPTIFITPIVPTSTSSLFFLQKSLDTDDSYDLENHVVLSAFSLSSSSHISYRVSRADVWLSVPHFLHDTFLQHFHYYIRENVLDYDNLIDLCIMVKNGGDFFETMLTENLPYIDKWTILDTGSTDNTIEIVNRVLNGKRKGQLFQEPFIDFPTSRNRCLDLAGTTCKYTIMLDDTYLIRGGLREFLMAVRGDQFASSYSFYVKSDDVEYTTNRIVKTENRLRYIFKLHEIISPENNTNVIVPSDISHIFDYRCDYMENRTMERKAYDLRVLEEERREDPDNPRNLYYLAQTYNLMKEYELAFQYFMQRVHHKKDGFIQEKHDALFEAGRIANFQLNRPWEECLSLYEQAYALDPQRPESQYFIGIHYYLEGRPDLAWFYFKRAYDIGYPQHCEFSLKPTLSYFYLPKFMAELCYTYNNNYSLGKEIATFFLTHNQPIDSKGQPVVEYHTMSQWYNIFSHLLKTQVISSQTFSTKPLLTFVADSGKEFGTWSGRDRLTKGMGGSETYIVEMARWIQRSGKFQVVVFCRCLESDIFEDVTYLPIDGYTDFISHYRIHTTIVSRFLEYVPCSIHSTNVENVCIVLHDIVQEGSIVPVHPKLKKIFCLTPWHVEHFSQLFPQLADKTMSHSYGVDSSLLLSSQGEKIPYKFIYSSYPNRGLLALLQMWPQIVEREPSASLYIYSDVNGEWVNRVAPNEMAEIRILLREYREKKEMHVFYEGWVSKQQLMASWKTADVWFYPTTFIETFCLTALECAISRALAITMDVGSLKNTVADRGVLLQGNPMNAEWQKGAIETVLEILENPSFKKELIERNYEWARDLTWENQANRLVNTL